MEKMRLARQKVCKLIVATLDVFNGERPVGKPSGPAEELGVWNGPLFEMEHLGKSGGVHFNSKVPAGEVELELLNTTFDCKNFFEGGVVVSFCLGKWSALVATDISLSVIIFIKNSAPKVIACIGLEGPGGVFSRDVQRRKILGLGFQELNGLSVLG